MADDQLCDNESWPRRCVPRHVALTVIPVALVMTPLKCSCGLVTMAILAAHYPSHTSRQDSLDFPFHRATGAEIEAGEGATGVVGNEAIGKLIEVADTEGVLDGLDFPSHRATEEEIAASTCGITYPTTHRSQRRVVKGSRIRTSGTCSAVLGIGPAIVIYASEGGGPVQSPDTCPAMVSGDWGRV